MAEALSALALLLLASVAGGLLRVLRGPGAAERMMAAQLLGTGGIAVLLLLAVAMGDWAVLDAALALAVLAAFASAAFAWAEGGDDAP
jgi:multicomponent Na+:H+ antiporter subunit F